MKDICEQLLLNNHFQTKVCLGKGYLNLFLFENCKYFFSLKLGRTGFMDEFNRLSLIKTNCSFQEAKKFRNKMKNRYETVYPCDDTRVKLQEIPGIQGSDYINANFVDSYQHKNSFIATQAPTECTIKDFWKMV